MSLGEVQRFYQKMQHDFDFFQLFNDVMQAVGNAHREQAIINFAQEHGFNFTIEELRQNSETLAHDDFQDNTSAPAFNREYQTPKTASPKFSVNPPVAELSVNKLEKFFIWLSGASPKILATCPESEQKKHAALGGAVLIPALLAIVTASFLLYTLNFNSYVIAPVALLWSGMILLMDRALLATYRKGFSFWGKLGQFSLRFTIALLIAVTVAHPVVLLLFSERIDAAYNEGRIKTERANLALKCDIKNPQSDLRVLDEKIALQRNEFKNSQQLFDPPICSGNEAPANPAQTPDFNQFTQEMETLKAKQIQADQDVALYIENAEKEKQGAAGNGLTGLRGCKKGSQCKKWLSQASERKDDSIKLGKEIVAIAGQLSKLNEKMADQLLERKKSLQTQCDKEREELKSVRATQYALDQKNLEALNLQRNLMSQRCEEKDNFIAHLKPDVLTQTELLTQLIFPNNSVSWHNLFIFLIFMLLFLAIDMLAVVLKMARIGIYETKVDIAESHNKLLEFVQQRHQLVTQFSQLVNQEQAVIEQLRVNPYQQDLNENFKQLTRSFIQADRQKLEGFFKD